MRQGRETSAWALCLFSHPEEILKDLVSNLFAERTAAFQDRLGTVLSWRNSLTLKTFHFLHEKTWRNFYSFLWNQTLHKQTKTQLKRPSATQPTAGFWLHLSCCLTVHKSLIKYGRESFWGTLFSVQAWAQKSTKPKEVWGFQWHLNWADSNQLCKGAGHKSHFGPMFPKKATLFGLSAPENRRVFASN